MARLPNNILEQGAAFGSAMKDQEITKKALATLAGYASRALILLVLNEASYSRP